MSEELTRLANHLESVISESGKEFLSQVTDEWRDFAEDIAQEMAVQLWTVKSSQDAAEVTDAKENLELLQLTIQSRLAATQLQTLGQGAEMIQAVIRVVGKTALGLLL